MNIYTRKGDRGETSLYGGTRVRKDVLRIDAYGTVDELNSLLGVAVAGTEDQELVTVLSRIQKKLFEVGADLSTPRTVADARIRRIEPADAESIEKIIDTAEGELEPLRTFILPGGTITAARLHHARTVCRRAERLVVGLSSEEEIGEGLVMYLNRLSDLLFVLARQQNRRGEREDIPWKG